jgi:hypothetical protein
MKPQVLVLEPCEACSYSPLRTALAVVATVRDEIAGLGAQLENGPARQRQIDAAISAVLDRVVARLSGADQVAPIAEPTPAAVRQRRYREKLRASRVTAASAHDAAAKEPL